MSDCISGVQFAHGHQLWITETTRSNRLELDHCVVGSHAQTESCAVELEFDAYANRLSVVSRFCYRIKSVVEKNVIHIVPTTETISDSCCRRRWICSREFQRLQELRLNRVVRIRQICCREYERLHKQSEYSHVPNVVDYKMHLILVVGSEI